MFVALVALVSLAVGAPGASAACPEPNFQDTYPYATFKQVVPIEVTQVTPGTEYLLKVNGRERKQGIADSDTISRKFTMPNLGDERTKAKLVFILANDGCENSPWKLKQTMGYRPPPKVQTQPEQTTQQQATPQSTPQATTPTPTPAPTPKTPKIKPFVPKAPAAVKLREPPTDVKTWLTPLDPYARQSGADAKAPQPPQTALKPSERKTEKANSTAALLGLGGFFILVAGISALAWTRFRRYDDSQLATLLNPDGKLPTLLDDSAIDMQGVALMGAAGVEAEKSEWKATDQGPRVIDSKTGKPVAPPKTAAKSKAPKIKAPIVPPAMLPPAASPADAGDEAPTEPQPVAHQNGALANGVHTNGAPTNGAHTNGAHTNGADVARNGNGAADYREEVEAELQRILHEAGLDAELGGILADAHQEAERRGVAIDSDLMLRALTEETNGSGKLSDSAKGELKERFKRIAAEERGEISPGTDQ